MEDVASKVKKFWRNEMEAKDFDLLNIDITWCPGCGNFALLRILKETFAELRINPENLVVVSGIGQSSKLHITLDKFFSYVTW